MPTSDAPSNKTGSHSSGIRDMNELMDQEMSPEDAQRLMQVMVAVYQHKKGKANESSTKTTEASDSSTSKPAPRSSED
ncbi:MAG: hypothetical protein GY894_12055 [Planctomycetes bacterium]|nr:hypothetical protein [Planctomycetota bacterium]